MGSISVLVAIAGLEERSGERYAKVLTTLADSGSVSPVLAHVYSEDDTDQLERMFDIDPLEANQLSAAAEHNTAVRTLSSTLDDQGIEHTIRGAIGNPGTEILRMADKVDADFILIGGQKRTPTGKALFGSTSQNVLLNSDRPVIYVGSDVI